MKNTVSSISSMKTLQRKNGQCDTCFKHSEVLRKFKIFECYLWLIKVVVMGKALIFIEEINTLSERKSNILFFIHLFIFAYNILFLKQSLLILYSRKHK
jgi:hypothetical protein